MWVSYYSNIILYNILIFNYDSSSLMFYYFILIYNNYRFNYCKNVVTIICYVTVTTPKLKPRKPSWYLLLEVYTY